MHRVVLLESIHRVGLDYLRAHQCEVVLASELSEDALVHQVRDADGMIVRTRGCINKAVMEAAERLKIIGRHGVGVENIDVDAATKRGIWVVNTPGANAVSVAEHALLLTLMLARNTPANLNALQLGDWNRRRVENSQEITGLTIGIIGFGRIGREVARIFRDGFRARVIFCDPKENTDPSLGYARRVDLADLLKQADVVSINVPLKRGTSELMDKQQMSLMKPSALLVNTAHGKVWNEKALYSALREGSIAGAATDVFEQEPASKDNPLFTLQNFVATPHIAAQTQSSLKAMAMVAEDIVAVINGGLPRYPVNMLQEMNGQS